jgi:hypothetical protein
MEGTRILIKAEKQAVSDDGDEPAHSTSTGTVALKTITTSGKHRKA